MPIKVSTWKCANKGCRKRDSNKGRMSEHEARCMFNPDRRACPTCDHDMTQEAEEDTGTPFLRYCAIDKRPEKIGISKLPVNVVYDCEHWEPKKERSSP